MTEGHNYFIWHPRLRANGDLVFNVTPGEQSRLTGKSKSLIRELVRSLKVSSTIESYKVLAYRSSYHGEFDAETWEDRLPVNWRVTVKLKKPPKKLPRLKDEYIGTMAFAIEALDEPEPKEIGAMVIADFQTVKDADKARSKIKASDSIHKIANAKNAPAPSFERVSLSESLIQEQIYLGRFPEPLNKSAGKYISAVERACKSSGGITNFEQRALEWDEMFDPEGIE